MVITAKNDMGFEEATVVKDLIDSRPQSRRVVVYAYYIEDRLDISMCDELCRKEFDQDWVTELSNQASLEHSAWNMKTI